jgi:hypothetical protein
MLLLRGAIRHSATAAAKRSGDSRYKIEPRVQVFCHPFKQRLEPRVHLAGRKIPASTMSGKRPFPNHSSSSKWRMPFARTPARSSRHHRGRSFGQSIAGAQIMSSRTDAIGATRRIHRAWSTWMAPRIEGDIRFGFIHEEPLVLLARCHLFQAVRAIDRGGRLRPLAKKTGPISRRVTNHPASPMRRRYLASGHGGTPVDNLVLKLWNESRTNRARIADSSLVGFVHGNIS